MELNLTHLADTPTPSATVVLLRDAGDGIELFLMRRHGRSAAPGGVIVFPGGKLDPADAAWTARLDVPAADLQLSLGEPALGEQDAASLFVAAIREVFEETGLLFADVPVATLRAAWDRVRAGASLAEVLDAGVRLAASALHPWSRWITPIVHGTSRRRFDTRFFLAAVPQGQAPTHDGQEATDSCWLTPREALQRYWKREIEIAPPQIMSLAWLARHRSVADALAAAARQRPPCMDPEPRVVDGVRTLCYPGDPGHAEARPIWPGPTRLWWRDGRFEPEAGLAILTGE